MEELPMDPDSTVDPLENGYHVGVINKGGK